MNHWIDTKSVEIDKNGFVEEYRGYKIYVQDDCFIGKPASNLTGHRPTKWQWLDWVRAAIDNNHNADEKFGLNQHK